MKIKNLIKITLLLFTSVTIAQNGKLLKEKKEKIKSIKIAYITTELDLTTDEATKFWPLYNSFEEKQQEIRKLKLRGYLDRVDDEDFDKLTDKEATATLAQMETTEEELFQLRKKFISSLKGVISPVKILKLKKVEEEFNRKLLKQYRDNKLKRR
jgi:Spy/CpxP family protein refolding chaperone